PYTYASFLLGNAHDSRRKGGEEAEERDEVSFSVSGNFLPPLPPPFFSTFVLRAPSFSPPRKSKRSVILLPDPTRSLLSLSLSLHPYLPPSLSLSHSLSPFRCFLYT